MITPRDTYLNLADSLDARADSLLDMVADLNAASRTLREVAKMLTEVPKKETKT